MADAGAAEFARNVSLFDEPSDLALGRFIELFGTGPEAAVVENANNQATGGVA